MALYPVFLTPHCRPIALIKSAKLFVVATLCAVLMQPAALVAQQKTMPRYNLGLLAERFRKSGQGGEIANALSQLVQLDSPQADELADTLVAIAINDGASVEDKIHASSEAAWILSLAAGADGRKPWYSGAIDRLMKIAEEASFTAGARGSAIHGLSLNPDTTRALSDMQRIVTSKNPAASAAGILLWSSMGPRGSALLRALAEQHLIVEQSALDMVTLLASAGWKRDPG